MDLGLAGCKAIVYASSRRLGKACATRLATVMRQMVYLSFWA